MIVNLKSKYRNIDCLLEYLGSIRWNGYDYTQWKNQYKLSYYKSYFDTILNNNNLKCLGFYRVYYQVYKNIIHIYITIVELGNGSFYPSELFKEINSEELE